MIRRTQRLGGAPIPSDPQDSLASSIAIDGPTASGKSVVGRTLAERLGLWFFDTGMMYRACTLAVLEAGVDPADVAAVIALVRRLDLDLQWQDSAEPRALLDGRDVTALLRSPEVERAVSLVSGIPAVRTELVRRQRALASRTPVVMVGRDIGTRVLTEARAKVFLDASLEVRARRRLGEQRDAGRSTTFERVMEETRRRDQADATGQRAVRREQAAPDALIIDTDMLGIDEVVEACREAYRAANAAA
ncbi:MAG: (d)CMP kinase [Dehalococcoidia bacterium]|nr:(d)CMP kinase [Dehalococcoidia bacterium]